MPIDAASILARIPDALGIDIDPDLRAQLEDPEVIRNLKQNPHAKIAGIGGRLVTARLLQVSWILVLTGGGVIGGLLGLAYLNLHFFAREVGHAKMFTPFGSEWRVWRTVVGWPSFGLKYGEVILLLLLDVLALLIVILAITFMWAMLHPCSAFATAIGWKWIAEKVCSPLNV